MGKLTIQKSIELTLDIDEAADWFAHLDDDQQTQFIVKVAEIFDGFKGGMDGQLYHIGGHLRNCKCSTDKARNFVESLHHYMLTSEHT